MERSTIVKLSLLSVVAAVGLFLAFGGASCVTNEAGEVEFDLATLNTELQLAQGDLADAIELFEEGSDTQEAFEGVLEAVTLAQAALQVYLDSGGEDPADVIVAINAALDATAFVSTDLIEDEGTRAVVNGALFLVRATLRRVELYVL